MRSRLQRLALCTLLILGACTAEQRFFDAQHYPQRLSEWSFIDAELNISDQHYVYDLNTALFSDYALKLRTLYIPAEHSAKYNPTDTFELPVGSIISKSFFYAQTDQQQVILQTTWDGNPESIPPNFKLIETRLLIKQADGWDALPYIWRGDDAYLSNTGDLIELDVAGQHEPLNYLVPSRNQCAQCHATNHTSGEIQPIGIKARHLNRNHPYLPGNQIVQLTQRGWLEHLKSSASDSLPSDIPANARWGDESDNLEHRARSYLDINCGHCHNPKGAADTSGLLLNYEAHSDRSLGVCKPPIASGGGSGGHLYSIVPGMPGASILTYRMRSTNPAAMMPEVGRSLAHAEGTALVEAWIASLSGQCI